eukprot:m.182617 g.182617  ORF g.182617 m.182617 type:complete len:157 (+) comp14673_c0_seq8:221-691(+)
MVVVADDCALSDEDTKAGARGLAGTVFVHKIAGAIAETGASLDTVAQAASMISKRTQTVGVAFSPCQVPGCGPSFTLPPNTMEIGLGIHGESGAESQSLATSSQTAKKMLQKLQPIPGLHSNPCPMLAFTHLYTRTICASTTTCPYLIQFKQCRRA